MDSSKVRFKHFLSKKTYCNLQEYFLHYDEKGIPEKITDPLDNPEILYKEVDEFADAEDYKNLKFEEDFIYKELPKLADKQYKLFKKTITKKGIYYAEDALDNFTKSYINKARENKSVVEELVFLSAKTIATVKNQLDELESLIDEYRKNPYPYLKNKIRFNWRRNDIIVFFHLLRENGTIEKIPDSDLGRIIDDVFECKNRDEYKPIKNSRKHLGAYNRNDRNYEPSLNKIKKILMDEDFYPNF